MYKPTKVNNGYEIVEFINGNDIYNSALLIQMKDIEDNEQYNCTKKDKRLDIVSQHLPMSESFLTVYNKIVKGEKFSELDYLTSNQLNRLIAESLK